MTSIGLLCIAVVTVGVLAGVVLIVRGVRKAAKVRADELREAAEMTAYEAEYAAANPPERTDTDMLLLWADTHSFRGRENGEARP